MPKKVDSNQAEICAALRNIPGVSVTCTHIVGCGFPDLAVGKDGKTYLLELKSERGKFSPWEKKWHAAWTGHVAVVRSIEEALAAIGVT
jgi:hypothetical protein